MKAYNVLNWDFNSKQVEYYDIMPYFIREYEATSKLDKPKTFDEFKEFIKRWGKYMFWSRCQYEIIISQWPPMPDSFDSATEVDRSFNENDEEFVYYSIPVNKLDKEGRPRRTLDNSEKIDIWRQIEMNLDIVATILMQNVNGL